jgi:uncharacterized protein (TIGR03435 family)
MCWSSITASSRHLIRDLQAMMRNTPTFPRTVLIAAAAIVAAGAMNELRVAAQAPAPDTKPPAFEVASVKQNKSGENNGMMTGLLTSRFRATNVLLRQLITFAYQIQGFQIEGGPGWISSDRFDIVAKAEGNPPPQVPGGPPGLLRLMLRALLADRFKLILHHQTKELPIYALVMFRADGTLGRQIHRSDADCAAIRAAINRGGAPPPPPSPDRPLCGITAGPGGLAAGGFPVSQLAASLSQELQRMVVDHTGLMGNFDLTLTWTPDQMPQGPAGGPDRPPIDPNGPSLFTALQEQLGLKLESTKGPVDVLVIDHVEQPTPD